MKRFNAGIKLFSWIFLAGCWILPVSAQPRQISGIYPSLAMYNNEGECGTGAVVPWAGKLWVITYSLHKPYGSSDKLYSVGDDLIQSIHPLSVGGTPANRMIHRESQQLFIGPYAIDKDGNVRVIAYDKMPGRHTANARHLTDPANKIYCATMEEGLYEIDVHTLAVKELIAGLASDAHGGHIFRSADGKAAVWAGVVDDLWKLGKPRGQGGPWKNSAVQAGQPSDPYLMTAYDKKTVTLSHDADASVKFRIEVDIDGTGLWLPYMTLTVAAGQELTEAFPDGFSAYWVRVVADKDCNATAWFVYE